MTKATLREQTIAHMVLQGWEPCRLVVSSATVNVGIRCEDKGIITVSSPIYRREPDDTSVRVVYFAPHYQLPDSSPIDWVTIDTNFLLMLEGCGKQRGVL